MAPIIVIWIWTLIGVNSCGVDSASVRYVLDCETDHQCPDGHYCFTPSHTCARCIECTVYKRTSSWRYCPKVPADCGKCLPGYEEEILAEGKTRDFCVASIHTSIQPDLIQSAYKNVQTTFSAHYFLVLGLLSILVPTIFYAFYWKKRTQSRLRCQHSSVPREEPPPYRNIELIPVSSVLSDSADEVVEENTTLVMNISHTKDRLTEATPFRRPDYEEQEYAYNTEEDSESEDDNVSTRIGTGNLELEDETTMPSDWTPDRVFDNDNQLVESAQGTVIEGEDQDCCQPSNKRRRKEPEDAESSDSNAPQQQQEQQQQQQSINFVINNSIIIKKED